MEQRKLVAPNVVGGVINSFIEESERRDTFNKHFNKLLHEAYKEINDINDELLELEYDVNALKKLISGKSDIREKERRYQEASRKLSDATRELGSLESDKQNKNDEISRILFAKESLIRKNNKYIKQRKQIEYAAAVLDVFNRDYSSNEQELKNKLENYVNANFEEVYSGERKIEIDEKYNAIAKNKVGNQWITSETSPGLETVKNFSFISGLVQCAKEKIIRADGAIEEANTNSYPLVLDAPFSQADERHVPAISRLISRNAEQIILVVMKKDWNYAEKELLPKVGMFYNLEKESETHTEVRKVKTHD